MKGSDNIMDSYVPLNWFQSYSVDGLAGLKTKFKKSLKRNFGYIMMQLHAKELSNSLHKDVKREYRELYEAIGMRNKGAISNVCSPSFSSKMIQKIHHDSKYSIKFDSINTSIENVVAMVPKSLFFKWMNNYGMDAGYNHLFQVTMKIDSRFVATLLDDNHLSKLNVKEPTVIEDSMTEYLVVEMAKANNEQHPWRFCGKIDIDEYLKQRVVPKEK